MAGPEFHGPRKRNPFSSLRRATVLHRGTFEDAPEEQKFVAYYNQAVFPNVTNPASRQSPKDDVLTKLRIDLKTCERAPALDVFNKLADLTLTYMTGIAKDEQYHPAARVDAMLVIGEVNSPKAVAVLLATLPDPDQIDAVRVVAMSDLVHLAGQSCMSNPDVAQPVVVLMAKIVGKSIVKNARADGIRWMHGQAADVLATLGNPGPKNEVPQALLTMLNDKDLPIPLRSKAARALGKLTYSGDPPAADPYLKALAGLARDALSADQPAHRGRVRQVARDVTDGLKPLAASAGPNNQDLLDGLNKTLKLLIKETEEKMTSDDLKEAIKKAKGSLDSLVK